MCELKLGTALRLTVANGFELVDGVDSLLSFASVNALGRIEVEGVVLVVLTFFPPNENPLNVVAEDLLFDAEAELFSPGVLLPFETGRRRGVLSTRHTSKRMSGDNSRGALYPRSGSASTNTCTTPARS